MIVNPRSTRMDQAAAYLTAYAGHYDAETENIMFFPDQNDPVPNLSLIHISSRRWSGRATVIWKRLAIPITAPGTWAM